jgi:hypothetical protein
MVGRRFSVTNVIVLETEIVNGYRKLNPSKDMDMSFRETWKGQRKA